MTSVRKVMKVGLWCKSFYDEIIDTLVCLIRVVIESSWRPGAFFTGCPVAYVLGTGPSLNIDIGKIASVERLLSTIFCVNDFYKSDHFADIRPDHYVIVDPDYWDDILYKGGSKHLVDSLSKAAWPITLWIPVAARGSILASEVKKTGLRHFYYNKTPLGGIYFVNSILFRLRLAMPRPQNVLVASIAIAIWTGSKEINLLGADHDWHKDIDVSDENILQMRNRHSYQEKNSFQPFYKPCDCVSSDIPTTFTVSEIFQAWAMVHRSYEQLQILSSKRGVKIFNCGSISFVDAFKRKKLS